MANNRRRHAQRPVLDPLVDLYDFTMPARFGGAVLRWTPGPFMSWGTNLVSTTFWPASPARWGTNSATGTQPVVQPAAAAWSGHTLPDCMVVSLLGSHGAGLYFDVIDWLQPTRLPVAPGEWFEAQAQVLGVRCSVRLVVAWINGAGSFLSASYGSQVAPRSVGAVTAGDHLELTTLQVQPPPGAAYVCFGLQALGPVGGTVDPLLFFRYPQLVRIAEPGGPPAAFRPASRIAHSVRYGGLTYSAVPIGFTGFEVTSRGAIPRPRVTLPNVGNFIRTFMATYGDLLGAKVSRRRVFAYALDDGERPDATDFYGPEVFFIDRVVTAAPEAVEFELCSPFDLQGKMLPNLQVIRDVCTHSYRAWDATTGSYRAGTCPYSGSGRWNAAGDPVGDPALDDCGRRLVDCKKRFPDPAEALPTRACPGVAIFRR